MKLCELIDLQENATAGATSAGAVATAAVPVGNIVRRPGVSFFGGKYVNSADPYPNTPAYMKKQKQKQKGKPNVS